MQQYLSQIARSSLFFRISQEDILRAVDLLCGKIVHYKENAIILHQGTPPRCFGILLHGCAHIISGDVSGNHALLSVLHPSDLFAESFVFSDAEVLPISVVASEDCTVLLLDKSRMTGRHRADFSAHGLLVANLLRIIANKNLAFTQKICILSQRSTRDKLVAYLLSQQQLAGSSRFCIPLDRQHLADYLCVERSAMSTELGKMKKEGMINFRKNEFEIFSLSTDTSINSRIKNP